MMLGTRETLLAIGVIAALTLLTRALPFLLFPSGRKTPPFVGYLGRVLPYAVMGMLVVYCLRQTRLADWPYGLPELIAAAAVVGLHLWKRNTLLSIAGGTTLYMLLIQFVF